MLIILLYQSYGGNNADPYVQAIEKKREQKNHQFATAPNSPISEKERKTTFKGLSYFPVEPQFQTQAVLSESSGTDTLRLETTKGASSKYYRAGVLTFSLLGQNYKLTAYRNSAQNLTNLFVPFKDLSSGVSSYPGGRYLDVEVKNMQEITLDFNEAYNPYCVYNAEYSCPVPPAENRLNIEILAGERKWEGK